MNDAFVFVRKLDGFVSGSGNQDVVSGAGEDFLNKHANRGIILHHQNRFIPPRRTLRRFCQRRFRPVTILRKEYLASGPTSWLAFQPNVSTALLDNSVCSGKSQARSLAMGLGCKKWLEHSLLYLGGNTASFIFHGEHGIPARRDAVNGRRRFVQFCVGQIDREGPAAWHGFPRIGDDVQDSLLHLGRIDPNRIQDLVDPRDDLDTFSKAGR